MVRCYCALGGNLGPVSEVFDRVLAELRAHPYLRVADVSRYHRTAAVGGDAGGDYLNAVVEIDTELPPLELLDLLQELENKHGRVREVHWGPRTLDLDVLFYGDQIIDLPRLIVPHPGAWFRRFVLDPMCGIAPDFVHPIKKLTIRSLRHRLEIRPLTISLAGGTESQRQGLINRLERDFPQVEFSSWLGLPQQISTETHPTFIVWLGECLRGSEFPSENAVVDPAAIGEWRGSLQDTVCNALQPAEVEDLILCPMLRRIIVLVRDDQFGLAIRRLKAKGDRKFRLVGWQIEIMTQTDLNEQLDNSVAAFSSLAGDNEELAEKLVAQGYFSYADLSQIDPAQLAEIADRTVDEVMPIIQAAARKMRTTGTSAFQDIPLVPRIAVTSPPDEFVRNLLRAALG